MGVLKTLAALVSLSGVPLAGGGTKPEKKKPDYKLKQMELRGLFWRSRHKPIAQSKQIRDGKLVLRCPRNSRGERLLGPDGRRLPAVLVKR